MDCILEIHHQNYYSKMLIQLYLEYILASFQSFFIYNISNTLEMSWYNTYSDTTKRLDQLIDSQPSLAQLLQFPDFLQLLKAYQPKLLEYISSSNDIVRDMVRYITESPDEADTDVRKHKLPLMTVLMIESNTVCVINSFFKINPNSKLTYFLTSFYEFLSQDKQLLPLLCGYFTQFNICLWNTRYKEVIDMVYEAKQPLILMTKHSYNKAIVNTLLLYLNLDLTRNNVIIPQRTALKVQILKILYDQIRTAFQNHKLDKDYNSKGQTTIQNISQILIQIVQKYYLISDGKSMLELVTNQQNVNLILDILMYGSSISLTVVGVVTWLMRYYCLSSFNTQDIQNIQLSRKNLQRLEMQPFIKKITELLPVVTNLLSKSTTLTLYHSKLIQIFNMALELSSRKLSDIIKKNKYIQMILGLLFKCEKNSILHKMTEKLFQQIFNSERLIYEEYRKYLFCEAGLIQLTVGQYLNRITDLSKFRDNISNLHEGYFSYLMRIIKIYSKIQTNDQDINDSIMKRSPIWQKFSNFVLKPYEALCFKDLGTYQTIKQTPPVQFSIKYVTGMNNGQQISKKVLQEINQQESLQNLKTVHAQKPTEQHTAGGSDDNLFNVQQFNKPINQGLHHDSIPIKNVGTANTDLFGQFQPSPSGIQQNIATVIERNVIVPEPTITSQPPKIVEQPAETGSKYQQFLFKQKAEVDKQIKLQRTNSSQKRLSANKSRVTSPSPKKKKWDDSGSQDDQKSLKQNPTVKTAQVDTKKQKISLTTPNVRLPMIPINKAPPSAHSHHQNHALNTSAPASTHEQTSSNNSNISIKQQNVIQKIAPTESYIIDNSQDVVSSMTSTSQQKQQEYKSKQLENVRAVSSSQLISRPMTDQEVKRMTKSAINIQDLRNIAFKRQRATRPQKSQYRKIQQKDKLLLDYLGIQY